VAPEPVVQYPVNAYCEVSHVTDALGGFTLPSPSSRWTDNDNREIKRAIVNATQTIDTITSQYFGQFTEAIELSGRGESVLWFTPHISIPALSVSKVQYRDTYQKTYDWDASAETIDEDTYDLADDRHSIVRLGAFSASERRTVEGIAGYWVKGHKNYRVTATWGRREVPMPIEVVCVLLTRNAIDPGWIKRHENFLRERWPDGYEYERSGRFIGNVPTYTGIDVVDKVLYHFVDDTPGVGFTVL